MFRIYVVSDATGETAERVIRSALVQFKGASVDIIRHGKVRTKKQVQAAVQEAAGSYCMILHTLVSDELRSYMTSESRLHGVDAMDLMGPVLDRLATHLKLTPQHKPGLFKHLVKSKSREIEAVEFAFFHDDGQRVEELNKAEIILVGVSRTMKTPTSLYLAYRGWFVGNVPLVPEIPPPPILLSLPASRIFCFFTSPIRLSELRRARSESQKIPVESYASLDNVRKELAYSRRLCAKHGWHQIDVAGKSIEELTLEIVTLYTSKHKKRKLACKI